MPKKPTVAELDVELQELRSQVHTLRVQLQNYVNQPAPQQQDTSQLEAQVTELREYITGLSGKEFTA